MSLYGRFFKPEEKSTLRRVLDRVDAMRPLDCRAYIASELEAMKELYRKKAKNGRLVYDKEENERHEREHRPLLDYIDAEIEKAHKASSTEADIDLVYNMQCIKDIIASDILDTYAPDGYGASKYDDMRVLDVILNDRAKNITMWPMMRWASQWNPNMAEYRKLYEKYEKMAWDEDLA